MKWLKKKYQENPELFIAYTTCFTTLIAAGSALMLAKENVKLKSELAHKVLEEGMNAFHEGYETAVSEIEMIAENKEMQKALKAAAK